MGYIGVPTTTDPNVIADNANAYLANNIPGWVPHDGNLEAWLITALSQLLSMSRDVASIVPDQIFEYYGESLINIPPEAAVAATVNATITVQDNAGYDIPSGTLMAFQTSGSTFVMFMTTADLTIPVGQTQALNVPLTAQIPGTAANGLTGAMTMVTPLSFVTAVNATTTSTGGVDAETSTAYLGRLTADLQLSAPRPILPADFAIMARNTAGVYRALAIDGYNPAGGGTFGNERMVAVAAVDSSGNDVSVAIQNAMIANLEAQREINFVVNWLPSTVTVVNVTYVVHLAPSAVWTSVEAAINAALTSYLSKANWGGGLNVPPMWDPASNVVRYLSVADVIGNVAGVNFVSSVQLNGATADVNLAGVAPLANVGVLTGSTI